MITKHSFTRFRFVFLVLGSLAVIILNVLTDPSGDPLIKDLPFGAGIFNLILILATSILLFALLHLARKAFLDYVDLSTFFEKAKETPEGAGLAIIGIAIIIYTLALLIQVSLSIGIGSGGGI